MSEAKTDRDAIAAVRVALMRYGGECEPTAAAARREMDQARVPLELFLTECERNITRLGDAIADLLRAEEPDTVLIAQKTRERTRWIRKRDETRTVQRTLSQEHAAFAAAQSRYRLAIEPLIKQGDTRMRTAREDVITYERVQQIQTRHATASRPLSISGSAGGDTYSSHGAAGSTSYSASNDSGSSSGAGYVPSRDELRTGQFSTDDVVLVDGLPAGMALVPLNKCDDENRINGPSDFTKGYSPDDLAWGVNALYEKVLPRMARGGDVAGLLLDSDTGQGLQGSRSLSDTYSGFFRDSAIKADRTADGTFLITNGAHRVWVARRLGITHLPARVEGLP